MSRTYNRPTSSVQRPPVARCDECPWTDVTAGALGRAAQHHDRTRHIVTVDVTRTVTYGAPPDELTAAAAATGSLFDNSDPGGPTG